jgi:hypothetical protein
VSNATSTSSASPETAAIFKKRYFHQESNCLESYPYTIANKQIEPMLTRIRTAARPERFNCELLNTWGFTASNDRAIISVLRGLGFIADGGTPTDAYDRLGGSTYDKPEDYGFMYTHSFVDPDGHGWGLVHMRAMPAQK